MLLLKDPGGGGGLGPWPALSDRPTHIRTIFLRPKKKFIKGAGNSVAYRQDTSKREGAQSVSQSIS